MRFKTAINVELPWSENTGGTTELFLVQITGCVFLFIFFCGGGGREVVGGGGAQTEWLLAMCFFLCIQTTALKAVFSPHFESFLLFFFLQDNYPD